MRLRHPGQEKGADGADGRVAKKRSESRGWARRQGLGLGLNVPAVGVSGCEARAWLAPKDICPAIPAPRDMVYLCRPGTTPLLMSLQEAQASATMRGQTLNSEYSPQG
ncbi:MAG: hypothetical protein L3K26_14515, partial [Candidatus Hydrogenedentes bacterium]|nr:hypothetical protein [Candidatus Hydrogenedentota bacterium]